MHASFRSFRDVHYQSNKFSNIMWHHDRGTSKEIYSVCSFIESSYSTVQITIPTQQRGVYTHLKMNIVIITLLFVFHKAAENFKTVIEGLYKEINIVCFFDRIRGNWTRELMQNTQSILNGLMW